MLTLETKSDPDTVNESRGTVKKERWIIWGQVILCTGLVIPDTTGIRYIDVRQSATLQETNDALKKVQKRGQGNSLVPVQENSYP